MGLKQQCSSTVSFWAFGLYFFSPQPLFNKASVSLVIAERRKNSNQYVTVEYTQNPGKSYAAFRRPGRNEAHGMQLAACLQVNKSNSSSPRNVSSVVFRLRQKWKGLPTYVSVQFAASTLNRSRVKLHWLGVTNYRGYRTISTLVEMRLYIIREPCPTT